MTRLKAQDDGRKYSIYVFNNENEYARINSLYLSLKEAKAQLCEITKTGTWLNKRYGHYKYRLVLDEFTQGKPIKVTIKDYLKKGITKTCIRHKKEGIKNMTDMKYNKKILKQHTENLFNQSYTLYVLDNKDFYDIHIIDDDIKDTELNTLYLQEPKQDVSLFKFDEIYMTTLLLEHALRAKFYGYKNKVYQFAVKSMIDFDL